VAGSDPHVCPIGSANVTWIIRWESMAQRNEVMKTVFTGAWESGYAKHPDHDGYFSWHQWSGWHLELKCISQIPGIINQGTNCLDFGLFIKMY